MNKLVIGLVAAAGIALATPASAQFYFGAGPGGIGVGVGGGPGYYDDGYRPRYRSYRSYGYDRGYARCRTRVVSTPYGVRRVRRCY
jgi:hypothetical protein